MKGNVPGICSSTAGFLHGGNVSEHPGALDFSANLNPLGMPEQVRAALHEAADRAETYPDPACTRLRAAIAQRMGVPQNAIRCTAGASDALMRICQVLRPARACVCAPCFSGYEKCLSAVGAHVERHRLDEARDFELDEGVLGAVESGPDALFLCNPDNPAGRTIDPGLLLRVLQAAQDAGTWVVLDESFLGFTQAASAAGLLEAFDRLVVVGSFTKLYCMAGVRLGYAASSDAALLEGLDLVGPDWAVSTQAQAAGCAALGIDGFEELTCKSVARLRESLAGSLRNLGLRVVPGTANFLLVRSDAVLPPKLARRNILVRPCDDYHGLDGRWMRVAVRTRKENEALAAAIEEVLGES